MIAFNGDTHMETEFDRLITQHGIKTAIETGTADGGTSIWLAKRVPTFTIEIDKKTVRKAKEKFDLISVDRQPTLFHDSSPRGMREILGGWNIDQPCLFYLDAHWRDYWPLLDELAVISELAPDSLIVIHDFKNPYDPTMGFDTYKGQDLDFPYIEDALRNSSQWSLRYNKEAGGARRGVAYIATGSLCQDF